jgi:hypothetical protein
MAKFLTGLILALVLLVLGGGLFLAFWNPPAPSAPVVKVLSNDRFPK